MTKEDGAFGDRWGTLNWSKWIGLDAPLEEYREHISTLPGFYRVKAVGYPTLIYVGETGRGLRERIRSLASNANRPRNDPPWNDPHTAAPLLWAYRLEEDFQFEVSAAIAQLDYQTRQCQEDALLYLHRLEHDKSTLCNHGRLHPWWTRPTNRKKDIPTQRRESPVAYPSLPSVSGDSGVLSAKWLNLEWSEFLSIADACTHGPGVYRIRHDNEILYFGESENLSERLKTHTKDKRFSDCHVSFHNISNVLPHQLKKRETDLIGAYFLVTAKPPVLQYVTARTS